MTRPMDRLDAMRTFVRLVESGSFSAVGREENIGQPAVSKKIAALEKHLGAQLVLRNSRRVVVTEAGHAFHAEAKRLLDEFDALESSVGDRQRSPSGLVRVDTAPVHGRLCIMPLLPAFFRRYPDVAIELSASARPVDLIGEGIDVAIRHGYLVDSSLAARKLTSTDLVMVASRGYLAKHGEPRKLADLDRHQGIVFARSRERIPWSLRVRREPVSYMPHGQLLTGDAEHVRAAVLCGLGIAQAPRWLVDDAIQSGAVRVLLPALQPERIPINLVFPAGRRAPARVRALIDHLLAAFADG